VASTTADSELIRIKDEVTTEDTDDTESGIKGLFFSVFFGVPVGVVGVNSSSGLINQQ
jgi:hypothetical protein